jgi:hypothetical protein
MVVQMMRRVSIATALILIAFARPALGWQPDRYFFNIAGIDYMCEVTIDGKYDRAKAEELCESAKRIMRVALADTRWKSPKDKYVPEDRFLFIRLVFSLSDAGPLA